MSEFLPNSCFGYSLQTGCKIISLLQLIIAFPLLILAIKDLSYSNGLNIIIASGTFVVVQVVQLIFAGCLFNGSKERHLPSCQLWAAVTTIVLGASGVYIFYRSYYLLDLPPGEFYTSPLIIVSMTSLLCNVACLWVGFGFIRLLLEEESEGGTMYNT